MTLKNKLKSYAMDNHYKKYGELNAKQLEIICLMFTSDFAEWLAYNAYHRWINGRWYNSFTYQDE